MSPLSFHDFAIHSTLLFLAYQVQTPQPFYYQIAPTFTQPPGSMDGSSTMNSNDSNVESNVFQSYPPQFYPQVIYTTTPMPQTPVAQMAPIYPAAQVMPTPTVTVANPSQRLDRTVSTHSDENVGENSSSA